jgi:pyruvate dehydrogenase E1 component beta subunit
MMVEHALRAAESLASEGIDVEIIDPRTLVPFDYETVLDSVRVTGRLVIAHEAVERAGWGAEVACTVMSQAFDYLDAPIARVCGANVPIPYTRTLESVVIPGPEEIAAGVRAVMQGLPYNRVQELDRG